ncbi:MAG TPA: discoidin domain-containing protein [Gaiellaceae bacterium]|nr:discoidin domain-containing protein [Gaiellaceae bacterium]
MRSPLLVSFAALVAVAVSPTPAAGQPVQRIVVDAASEGRTFEGIGGVSAGGAARLLRDYPEPERTEVLRYLFAPRYGASLQLLKVEIGGDTDTTAGAEPSHMRAPTELTCNRGYEWWLMEEAKKLNPSIKLLGLEWGAPAWVGEGAGTLWTNSNVAYQLGWLDCAAARGLPIDYVGGWNEWGHDKTWFQLMKAGLRTRHPSTKLIAADSYSWALAADLVGDPAFSDAVDVVGMHHTCGSNQSLFEDCSTSETARGLRQPLWSTEQSALDFNAAASSLARKINRSYIDGRYTATMFWSVVASSYENLPLAGRGLVLANHPWSGYYRIGKVVWALAHTTQFAEPGWRYVDGGSGDLSLRGSHVSLRNPETGDYSVVVETTGASAPQTVAVAPVGAVSTAPLHVWATDLASDDSSAWFRYVGPLAPGAEFVARPDHLYSFTTTTGQSKGGDAPSAGAGTRFPLPYREGFERYGYGQSPRYVADMNGAFETAPCRSRPGSCLEQVVTTEPVAWSRAGRAAPVTLVGDPRWWGDYKVGVDVNILQPGGHVELAGRVDSRRGFSGFGIAGYRLRLATNGAWRLYTESASGRKATLARGRRDVSALQRWHRLVLEFAGSHVKARLDGDVLADVATSEHPNGHVGVATGGYYRAQFDNLSVSRSGPWPSFVPHAHMRASASSFVYETYVNKDHRPAAAIDDRPSTRWLSSDPLPESLTLELDRPRDVHQLAYTPHVASTNPHGAITRYEVAVSADGATYAPVAFGSWPATSDTKVAYWPTARGVKFVRLTAVEAIGGQVAVGDVQVGVPTTGYYVATRRGGVHAFGKAVARGVRGQTPAARVVGMASRPRGTGYWLATAKGNVYTFGDAAWRGSLAGRRLAAPVIAIAATRDGRGYWLATRDGRVYPFGSARRYGSLARRRPPARVVAFAAHPSGRGYWLVTAEGTVFGFGRARSRGSATPSRRYPIVSFAPTGTGSGYWLATAKGKVHAFGDAPWYGPVAGRVPGRVVALTASPGGGGYWLTTADGRVLNFGAAPPYGGVTREGARATRIAGHAAVR